MRRGILDDLTFFLDFPWDLWDVLEFWVNLAFFPARFVGPDFGREWPVPFPTPIFVLLGVFWPLLLKEYYFLSSRGVFRAM